MDKYIIPETLWGIDIPDNTIELEKCNVFIEKQKRNFKILKSKNKFTDDEHLTLYELTCNVLNYVGNLSNDVFSLRDVVESAVKEKIKDKKLANKKFMLEYEKLHSEYNLLKNKCFLLLDDYDKFYKKINGKYPNNYNG